MSRQEQSRGSVIERLASKIPVTMIELRHMFIICLLVLGCDSFAFADCGPGHTERTIKGEKYCCLEFNHKDTCESEYPKCDASHHGKLATQTRFEQIKDKCKGNDCSGPKEIDWIPLETVEFTVLRCNLYDDGTYGLSKVCTDKYKTVNECSETSIDCELCLPGGGTYTKKAFPPKIRLGETKNDLGCKDVEWGKDSFQDRQDEEVSFIASLMEENYKSDRYGTKASAELQGQIVKSRGACVPVDDTVAPDPTATPVPAATPTSGPRALPKTRFVN